MNPITLHVNTLSMNIFARNNAIYEVQLFKLKQNRSWYCSFSLLTKCSLIAKGKIVKLQRWRKMWIFSYPSHVNGNSHCVTGTTTPMATYYYLHRRVWTPCLMHRCVISTMFGSCFSFLFKILSFIFYIFMCFLFLLLLFIIKIKCFFFTFVFLFIWMQVWSLEKEDTSHSFLSRVFFHYYKFYFFLFSTLYLVSSFL